jgi:hypothetical protein
MARVGDRELLDPTSEPYDFFSAHPGVVHFIFADGTVRALRGIDLEVLRSLATRAGEEAVPDDF